MVMDPYLGDFSESINGFEFYDDTVLPGFDPYQNLANGFSLEDETPNLNFMDLPFLPPLPEFGNFPPSSSVSSPDDHEFSDGVLKYINQILMEEKPTMLHDPSALKAAEKSLYETIGEKYPPSPDQPPLYFDQNIDSSDEYIFGSSSENSTNSSSSGTSNSVDSHWIVDPTNQNGSALPRNSSAYSFQPTFQTISQRSFGYANSLTHDVNGQVDSSMVSAILSESESISQFKRGMEEANKFLPSGNQIIIDLEKYSLPPNSVGEATEAMVKVEKDQKEDSPNGLRGRKNHYREDGNSGEERSSKQSAVYVEECELSELFDRVLLFKDAKGSSCYVEEKTQQNGQPHGSNDGKTRPKKQGDKEEVVDLRTLLINCAQSVAGDDRRTANEQLKQIRRHSSPSGNATQRLANIFATSLEARLAGTGSQIHAAQISRRITAAEKMKAYQLFLSACPFKKMAIFYATKMILDLAENATDKTLHIIDFGILYGFQWPILIEQLSMIPGGPPKLRITGIEFPKSGFRPAELVEATGLRLAKYCERFNVPFQYHAVAQQWETIKIEDLKIESDELLVVNSFFRSQHIIDETVAVDSPRDSVLKLIRKMNPDVFIHSIVNGSYNAPFFVTRFREALFYYSAWFDMLDTNVPREDQERMNLEREFLGREVMNVIACEGAGRVERPETYKQWQIRTMRAGFRPVPLSQELLKKLRAKVKGWYHRDFVIDEDGQWMLQGWKGRILSACSCWVPA